MHFSLIYFPIYTVNNVPDSVESQRRLLPHPYDFFKEKKRV